MSMRKKPPKPPPAAAAPFDDEYDRHKESARRREAWKSSSGRDIGQLPDIEDWERRELCQDDPELFCRTYNPEAFSMPFSSDHETLFRVAKETLVSGHLHAFAMPRGSGKTSICRMLALWAISYAKRRYVFMIGANLDKAQDNLAAIKMYSRFLPLYAADFPEIAFPAQKLGGIANRASGQLCKGEPTLIEWGGDRIVLPTVPPSKNWPKHWPLRDDGMVPTSGSVVSASGLTGDGIRGSLLTLNTGESLRPDFVILDDPQTNEALDVDTPIPTPSGFIRMGDIKVGDVVFDEHGQRCNVTGISDVMHGRACFRVTFDDGASVVADAGHLWTTSTALQRTNARRRVLCPSPSFASRPQCQPKPVMSVRCTLEIMDSLRGEGGRANHSIPFVSNIECDHAELPVPPYTLGVWLGDGTSSNATITTADPDILNWIADEGFIIGNPRHHEGKARVYNIFGLAKKLRLSGLSRNKHVPDVYLFADRSQRLALLQGLMDTDGCCAPGITGIKGTRCIFSNTNFRLVRAVMHLCRSLGIKANCVNASKHKKFPNAAPGWWVTFITTVPVFRLKRKLSKLPQKVKSSMGRRYIDAVEPVSSRPVRCIAVDSPSKLYLCGHDLIATHNSSRSPTQNATRLQLVSADILGMAGPGKTISALMPCTVISPGDMVDQILDRKQHPLWRGERRRMLNKMPTNMAAWDIYFEIFRECAQLEPPNYDAANAHYIAHRDELDEGAEASWQERKLPWEVSAVQHAMHLYCRDMFAFMSEYQNQPLSVYDPAADLPKLTPDDIMGRLNNHERLVVPAWATTLTLGVDCQQAIIYYTVVAWGEHFDGAVIDYGAWPKQARTYYSLRDASPTVAQATKQSTPEAALRAGLDALVDSLMAKDFQQEAGMPRRIAAGIIDSGWKDDVVYRYCRESQHAAALIAGKGLGITAGKAPIADWKPVPGEKRQKGPAPTWSIRTNPGKGRHIIIDTNFWKTFVYERLLVPPGDKSAMKLWGKKAVEHRLFADHLCAETRVKTEGRGRRVEEWSVKMGHDNHFFDCAVYAAVAASMHGIGLSSPPKTEPRPKATREDYERKRAAFEARRRIG